jgi:CTP-dependent riboflavin kinase
MIRGVVVSGTGQASSHTVSAFKHYPGSLNVFVGRKERLALFERASFRFDSSRSVDRYFQAKFFEEPVWVGFSRDKFTIELFSEKPLRATFGLKDGDRVKVFL